MFTVLANKISYKQRKRLKDDDFAYVATVNGKKVRKYIIKDLSHARNALSRVSQFGTSKMKKLVRSKVYERYPQLKKNSSDRKKAYAELITQSQNNINMFCNIVKANVKEPQFSCNDNYVFIHLNKNAVRVPFYAFCIDSFYTRKMAVKASKILQA